MDVPTIHHGSERPDKKYSSVLFDALLLNRIPIYSEKSIYEKIITQSIQWSDIVSPIKSM
tara:strand:- start:535 stop:714 length:180 start_codon:yes stop_codon:yes gene_type:complete